MEGITIMPLITRGSRSNRLSDLALDELQNVHEAKKSTWEQMMELFLTPCNPSPAGNSVKPPEIMGPIDVDTCESRYSYDEMSDTQVVTREQPEEQEDLLDYVFENVESTVCRGDAENDNETNGKELLGGAIHELRRNNSLVDQEDIEEDMSTNGKSQKLRNGDELLVSRGTGEIVHKSKHVASERTTKSKELVVDKQKGKPDILDYVFGNTEAFVCGESITPEEMIMDPDEDDGIIGACSFRDQDPEPPTHANEPEPPTQSKEVVETPKVEEEFDGMVGACSFRDQDPEPPTYAKEPEPPTQTKEVVETPKVEEESDGMVGACFECFILEVYDDSATVATNQDALDAQYYSDASENERAENAELLGMVVAPYALNRDISVISAASVGEASQATTVAVGNVTEAEKSGHKKKNRVLLGGVFGRRRVKR
jgi:hypothetical protein